MSTQDMQDKIESLKDLLLVLDCKIDALLIQRGNIDKAIGYLESDLFDRIMENAIDHE